MSARRIVIGCSATAAVLLAFLVIGIFVAYKHVTAPVLLLPAARLADAESLGLAVARLEPDDPWIQETWAELSKYSVQEKKPSELFPIELIWAARRGSPAPEGQILSLSLSRNGRLLGMMGDFALWRAARSESGKVSRVEHHGEGITSFPGTSIKGHIFIRNNTIVWSSDLDTAKVAVDLTVAAEQPPPAGATGAVQLPITLLFPQEPRHVIAGAILNENGSLARILELLPGDAMDVPADRLATVASLSFTFDPASAREGSGEVVLVPAEGASPDDIRVVAEDLAARLALLRISKVALEAAPRVDSDRAVIVVKATGLDSIRAPLMEEMVRSIKRIERLQKGGRLEGENDAKPPADPNQSSSTFQ